ncbi:hypothetical protein [Paenibacillus sp. IITD108]|uniref:hypothetical protein n=1 Tax=Paenibacillus sp. IITD108 TaxID=3116649 RepID=UPI002F424104
MTWTLIWFLVNIVFVTSFIFFLFRHRAYSQAKLQGASDEQVQQLKRLSNWSGLVSALLFLITAGIFIANMKING